MVGRTGRIVLFGATGYTGELTARALVARGAEPVLAARSQARVEALADELGGLPFAVADVLRPASVRALVEAGDVLISTVGPFVRWGEPALHAAIDAGAHYLDSTGEPPFIRSVFEHRGENAEAAGVGLLTAFGYDYVPGNLAGALALREAGERAVSVDVGYFVDGPAQPSGGTRASAVGLLAEPAYVFEDGRIVTRRTARSVHSFDGRPAVSVGATEQFALARAHPGLRDARVWLGWFGAAARPLQAISAATAIATKLPGMRDAIGAAAGRLVKGSTGGPDAAMRAQSRSQIVAVASDAAGAALATVRLDGVNPYDFTGAMLAWGAITA
ncbi:MAG: hypothetical protein QOI64_2236, partial [Solirubrobacteraceae bacterium]|nr:hypothetical protein [Solirubrobacteraceae bacterium]